MCTVEEPSKNKTYFECGTDARAQIVADVIERHDDHDRSAQQIDRFQTRALGNVNHGARSLAKPRVGEEPCAAGL